MCVTILLHRTLHPQAFLEAAKRGYPEDIQPQPNILQYSCGQGPSKGYGNVVVAQQSTWWLDVWYGTLQVDLCGCYELIST